MTTDPKDPADPNPSPADKDKKPDHIPRSKYDELLDEKKKVGERARLAEEALAKIAADKKAADDAEALKRGEHEKVIKQKDDELAAERAKTAELNQTLTDNKKLGQFVRAVGGTLDPKWFPFVDLDRIAVDKDGKIDEGSLTKYVEEYKKKYPETISVKAGSGKPGVPDVKPGGSGAKLTIEEWKLLPLKERRSRMSEVE